MLSLNDLRLSVPSPEGYVELLHGITFESSARTIAVIGENGSGKSTMAKALAGILEFSEGTITVAPDVGDSFEQFTLEARKKRLPKALRGRIGMIFAQASAQVIMPTVEEDVQLSLRGRGLSKDEVKERVAEALEEHELTDLAERPCFSLSSGQLQRLALCSVLIGRPDLVIADEPTSMLDARHERIIRERLLNLPEPTQLVVVTHDLSLAATCDDAVWIHQGRLAGHGEPYDVIARYLEMLDGKYDPFEDEGTTEA